MNSASNDKYGPELEKVFSLTPVEHIIKECVYIEANIGDSRPFSDFKKKFKFPLFAMSKKLHT